MNSDTLDSVPTAQLETGLRTLMHDWRNVLNGINLRISAAISADETSDAEEDLVDAQQLIKEATQQLTSLSRKLVAPTVMPISYPAEFFIEDLAGSLRQKTDLNPMELQWKGALPQGAVVIDFAAISQSLGELIENTRRQLPTGALLSIEASAENGRASLSWEEPFTGTDNPAEWGKTPFSSTGRGKLGLGVYYARRILAALGGELRYEASNGTLKTSVHIPMELA